MIVKVKDLEPHICGIYKIEYPNHKVYIGLSNDIQRRMYEYNNIKKSKQPCDLAIKKYGKIEEIEILEFCNPNNREKMSEREKYWIAYYDSNNKEKGYNLTEGGENSTLVGEKSAGAKFTNSQVLDIRKRRYLGERKRDVYKDYNDINFSTFEHVWLGRGYPNVGTEYLIEKGAKTRQEYSSIANAGENNNKAKLKEEDVREIRKRYDSGETWQEIYVDYKNRVSKNTIISVCKRWTWKSVI